ncbi:MAG: 1-phosphofructokinase family hexose kinase [Intestinibacillus sp.]
MIITITLNPAIDRTLRIDKPLQPSKLNRAIGSHVEPGGKGINVSRAIKAIGGDSVALSFSAGTNGRALKDALTSMDIHHDFVDVCGQTRVNIQIIDSAGEHTEINEPGDKISDGDFLRFLERVQLYLDPENIFVVTGSTPPGFTLKNFGKLCRAIKDAGCRLIVDAEGEWLLEALKYEPDCIKPNVFELADVVGCPPAVDPEIVAANARKVLDMGARTVCVSMGQEGAVFVSKDSPEPLFANTNPKIAEEGAVGTGDSMVAAIANGMRQNIKLDEIAKFAVAAGRACARLPGTEMATLKKVYEVYETVELYVI